MGRQTRREFIKETALAGAGFGAKSGWGVAGFREILGAKGSPELQIQVATNGLLLDGKLWPIYSGSFHYWRHDRELWPAIFDSIAGLGLQTICTYIPWGIHEIERGRFDFGQLDSRKDVATFLRIAHNKGFKVLVRPGPHINSELTYFGFPQRIVFDERAQLRSASGTRIALPTPPCVFPVPSYASDWFFDEVAVYFDALMTILRDLLYPKGPIIAIQSDNENSYFFSHGLAYFGDYHPDSIAKYRSMLERKYEQSIQKLNERYGTHYTSFNEVVPPHEFAGRRKEDIPFYLDWAEYREHYLTESENRIGKMFRERGITNIPIFQCMPGTYMTPFNLPAVEAAGVVAWSGINLYPGKNEYGVVKRAARAGRILTRFPEIPEFGGGIWIYTNRQTRDARDVEFCSLAAIMHGFKGFNYYMIVERDRWLASPITRDNRRRAGFYETYSKVIHFVRDNRLEDFEKQVSIALITNNDADRFATTFSRRNEGVAPTTWPISVPLVDLGLACNVTRYRSIADQTYGALNETGYDFDFGTTEVPLERLKKYTVIGIVTMDFLSRGALAKLRDYVRVGGHLVVGPVAPTLNEDLRPDSNVEGFFIGSEDAGQGSVAVARNVKDFVREVTLRAPQPEFTRDNPALDLALHISRDGRRKLAFVANPTRSSEKTHLMFSRAREFRNLWGGRNMSGTGSVEVNLEPYSVGVWEVSA